MPTSTDIELIKTWTQATLDQQNIGQQIQQVLANAATGQYDRKEHVRLYAAKSEALHRGTEALRLLTTRLDLTNNPNLAERITEQAIEDYHAAA